MYELIDNFYNFIKPFILFIITGIISIFSPLQDILYALFLSFLFNIITGIITDVHVNKKTFEIKKAFDAIIHFTFYIALVYFIYNVSVNLGDADSGRVGVKWATYIVIYFYLTNILRNASKVFPQNQTISFMYMVLTTQIFSKLKDMLGVRSNNNNTEV